MAPRRSVRIELSIGRTELSGSRSEGATG
jgi:hypothetical protein